MDNTSERLSEIINSTIQVAQGNYDILIKISDRNDELDSLAMGVNMMISDIKEAHDEIEQMANSFKEMKEYAERIIQLCPSALITIDTDRKITAWNRRAEEITGYSKQEAIGRRFEAIGLDELLLKGVGDSLKEKFASKGKIYTKDKGERLVVQMETPLIDTNGNSQGSIHSFQDITSPDDDNRGIQQNRATDLVHGQEDIITTKDDNERIVLHSRSKLFDGNGLNRGQIYSFEDITEKRRLEEFKESIEQIMRHDLRSPLQMIINLPFLFEDNEKLTGDERDILLMAADSGQTMLDIIESSLLLYKVESGTTNFELNKIDLKKVIGTVVKNCSINAKSKEISLDCLFPEKNGDTFITGNNALLCTLFTNLVKNSIEASPQGRRVNVTIHVSEKVEISVENEGDIPEHIRPVFFEKFSTAGKKSGTGLGTYSAKLMAEIMNGSIDFKTGNGKTILNVHFKKYNSK